MRKVLGIAAFALTFALAGFAQQPAPQAIPNVEVFGGYSWMHTSAAGSSTAVNANGIAGSVDANMNRWLGVVGQFGGYFGSPSGVSTKTQTYLFGPTFALRNGSNVTPFVHALFGRVHESASYRGVSSAESAFGYGMGGGVDWVLSNSLAVRLGQIDYIRASFSGTPQNNIRFSTGVVFHFGSR